MDNTSEGAVHEAMASKVLDTGGEVVHCFWAMELVQLSLVIDCDIAGGFYCFVPITSVMNI